MKLLLIEDDPMIGVGLEKALKKSGYSVDWLQDAIDAEHAIASMDYSLIILDLGLPGKDGIEFLRDLRAKQNNISVLILTARDAIEDRVAGLDIGADDYMIKPFALEELEARIRLLSRRKSGQKTNEITINNVTLNLNNNEIRYGDVNHILSAKEFALMRLLMEQPNNFFSRARLEESLYGWNEEVESNAIEVYIHQLRKKLGKNIIKNIRNIGYKIGDCQ